MVGDSRHRAAAQVANPDVVILRMDVRGEALAVV